MVTRWNEVRIGDVGRIITGRTPSSERPEYFGGDYPFITPSDMREQKKASSTERYLSEEGAKLLYRNLLPPGSIAVSCIGWQMGKVIMITRPSFTNQQLNAIVPNGHVDADYLYYSLTLWRQRLLSIGSAAGVRTPILNKKLFTDLRLELPPLPLQHKIAHVLSAYDDLIENNTRRIKILEEMAQMLYREWFVHFRFPGHEHVRMVESVIGMVPEGWDVVRLADLACEVRRGVNPNEIDPDTPYFGLEHLPRKSIALTEWGTAKDVHSTKLAFKKGEILFGKIRPYFHKVGVAPVDGVCSSDTIVISPIIPVHFAVVLGCVSSEEFVSHATQTSQGTKMPRANWDVLIDYQLVVPSSSIGRQFTEIVSDIVGQIQNMIFRIRNLRRTRDFILPKLMSGDIDTSAIA